MHYHKLIEFILFANIIIFVNSKGFTLIILVGFQWLRETLFIEIEFNGTQIICPDQFKGMTL